MASLPVQTSYAPLGVAERVPDVAKVPEISAASIIQERRKVRYVPQGSQTFSQSGPNQINVLLMDNAGYLDPQSVCLSGKFQITSAVGTGGTYLVLDDGIFSLFDRMRLYVNGVLVEDQGPGLARKVQAEIYSSCPKNWYDSQGTSLGLYKFNNQVFSNNADPPGTAASNIGTWVRSTRKNNPTVRAPNATAWMYGGSSSSNYMYFSMPLSVILGFFRSEYLFPLRNAGTIQLSIDIASNVGQSFVSDATTPPTSVNWNLNDLTIEADVCQMDPRYIAVMDSLISDPSQDGYRLPLTTCQVLQISYSSGSGPKTLVVPKATSNVRQVMMTTNDTANLTAANQWGSAFPDQSYSEAQLVIGSRRYPEVPASGYGRAFATTQDGCNALGNILGGGLLDMENFAGQATGQGTVDSACRAFIWAYSFDKVKSEFIPLDGESTNSVGGQIQVYLNNAPANSQTLTVSVETTIFLQIKANAVSVIS